MIQQHTAQHSIAGTAFPFVEGYFFFGSGKIEE